MEFNQILTDIKTSLGNAKSVLIVTHPDHTDDSIGATLALYLGLTGLGKSVSVASPQPIQVGLSDYIAADKIKNSLGKKNFVISLPYKDGSIEKVSYNIEDDHFNLVIEPHEGFEFSKDMVSYGSHGGSPDCVVVVDTIHWGKLGNLYEENKDIFAGVAHVINVDVHADNTLFGTVNMVDPEISSTTELVAVILSTLGVQLTTDIATNILNAVYETTKNFTTQKVNARTFEVASVCMKAGGIRFTETKGQEVIVGKHEEPHGDEKGKKADEVHEVKNVEVTPHTTVEPEEWLKPDMNASADNH